MDQAKQTLLIDYLVKHNFNIPANVDLQKTISGMTAQQIIQAMEIAKDIQSRLMSTSLGRELT
jgi:hypothetical protein